jgi:ubiquinone/menaquinone biosynthesis C-methylase UbiE
MENNIEEQRYWNSESVWADGGNEWNHELGMDYMWENNIGPMISPYAKGKVLEIACGYGRITAEVIERCPDVETIYVSDLNETCISKCVERFGSKVAGYFVNDGKSLSSIPSEYVDFVLSYDAFVHMHMNVVISYLNEIERILKPGGYCSLHISRLDEGHELSFANPGGRAKLDHAVFQSSVENLNMSVVDKRIIRANHYSDVDDFFVVLQKSNVQNRNIFEI